MRTFEILETIEYVHRYEVRAESEQEALQKINESYGGDTDDVCHTPEYDKVIDHQYQCEGEVK